ncbi:MAG: hypothetical protein OSJ74_08705 [Clostridia bacterium]|nr:hypothetical protein [Clostridia bacterium]
MDNKEIEIVARGTFDDGDYQITTIVIRLLGALFQEELDSHELNVRECFATDEVYQVYRERKKAKQKRFREKIREILGLRNSASFVISNSLSEIYTVVAMYQKRESTKEGYVNGK